MDKARRVTARPLRLLAPALREKRAKPGQSEGILPPPVSASPRKEGAVYHILSAQGQTQFGRSEDAENARFGVEMAGQGGQFSPPVLGPVGRFDQPADPAGAKGGLNLLEAGRQLAGPPGKAKAVEHALRQQPLDLVGEIGWRGEPGLRRAGELVLLHRRLD